jgi:hypothetical protein
MRINKAGFTFILTFLMIFVFNTGVAMEMEQEAVKETEPMFYISVHTSPKDSIFISIINGIQSSSYFQLDTITNPSLKKYEKIQEIPKIISKSKASLGETQFVPSFKLPDEHYITIPISKINSALSILINRTRRIDKKQEIGLITLPKNIFSVSLGKIRQASLVIGESDEDDAPLTFFMSFSDKTDNETGPTQKQLAQITAFKTIPETNKFSETSIDFDDVHDFDNDGNFNGESSLPTFLGQLKLITSKELKNQFEQAQREAEKRHLQKLKTKHIEQYQAPRLQEYLQSKPLLTPKEIVELYKRK